MRTRRTRRHRLARLGPRPDRLPGLRRSGPSCVKTRAYNTASGYTVQVRNTCNRTVRIKVVMRLGRDGKCTTLRKGAYHYHRSDSLATWKETVTC